MQSECAREAAEYRAKGSKPRERSQPQPTAMSLYFVATRRAKLTRRGTKAMRKETAFLPRPTAGPGFLAFYRSMQAYETGLKGSDTRMVMSPKSDFFRFFGTPNGQPATPAVVAPSAPR
jgi:membrane protease subunit HflC